jgi:hypothetical protein
MPDEPAIDPAQGNGTPPPPPIGSPPGAPAATFTQADVDRINAETRRKAEESAQRKLLDSLGITDVDAGKAIIEAARAAEENAKTELQRAQDEAARYRAQAEQANANAEQALIRSRVENALRDAGINPARVDGAIKLASLGDVKVTDSGVVGVESVVEGIKTASPEWFGAPGRPFQAPDASGGGSVPVDFRTAPPEAYEAELRKLGVSRPPARFSY